MDRLRIGNGFDVHPFVTGRSLMLGGKKIDHRFGLQGHSDADVLVHSIIDSILGAAGLGDIGRMFPDTDERYRDISSIELLGVVAGRLKSRNVTILNIDSVVICQEPRIAPHVDDMKENISRTLGLDASRIGIKGKTTEGLGFTGRGEGIAACSVCLLQL
jgi:2-C-methyl-D-erythritol 2,4-cyclodiphosphate synthase